jgi:hypothetical protein
MKVNDQRMRGKYGVITNKSIKNTGKNNFHYDYKFEVNLLSQVPTFSESKT